MKIFFQGREWEVRADEYTFNNRVCLRISDGTLMQTTTINLPEHSLAEHDVIIRSRPCGLVDALVEGGVIYPPFKMVRVSSYDSEPVARLTKEFAKEHGL